MEFHLFIYATLGRRHELEAGMAGQRLGQGHPELLVGDPDSISRRIEEASKAIPIKECFLLIPQGIHDRDQILTSLDLFANKIMPRFAE